MKKILIFNIMHIGDFILTLSAVAILKKAYPEYEITLICPKTVKTLAENNPIIDKVIYCSYPEYNFKSRIKRFLWIISNWFRLFIQRYDYCIILDSSRLSIITAKTLFIKTFGVDKNLSGVNVPQELQKFYGKLHNINRPQRIVKSDFSIFNNALPIIPDYSPYSQKTGKLIKDKNKINIALCLRGAGDKRGASSDYGIHSAWDINNFIETVNMISERRKDIDFYVVGAKSDYEYAQELLSKAKNNNVINLCGQTSLIELISFINQTDLLISVDTGTTHCCALTKTHIIVLCPDVDYTAPVTPRLTEISGEKISLIKPETVCEEVFNVLNAINKL